MGQPIPADLRVQAVDEAIAWVKSIAKSVVSNKEAARIAGLAQGAYDEAEVIARIVAADKARELLRAVNRAIRTGEISKKWANPDGGIEELSTSGLARYDPRQMFQTVLRSAYGAGRYSAIVNNEDGGYTRYMTQRDDRVRWAHRVLDGLTVRKSDPNSRKYVPPLGHSCRCFLDELTAEEVQALKDAGEKVKEELPDEPTITYKATATSEEVTLPASIQPGFQYIPGSPEAAAELARMLERRFLMLQTET